MASHWDPAAIKAHLRLTAKRLGQIQDKKEAQAPITRKDIATLLQRRNLGLARAKAQNLVQDDAIARVLELLEMHCGALLEYFNELENPQSHNPAVIEAASSIIYAAPIVDCKELDTLRTILINRLGPDFTRSAVDNADNYVSKKIIRALEPPTASDIDDYLYSIAQSFSINWAPDLKPHQKLNILSEILDTSDFTSNVDMDKLRSLSSSGLPNHPPWIRPRIWKLLLGVLPSAKSQWTSEAAKTREAYYDLVRRLLHPIADAPPTTIPLPSFDRTILNIWESLTRLPHELLSLLEQELELSELCPLHSMAPPSIRITFADALDERLASILQQTTPQENNMGTPEIRLEVEADPESPPPTQPNDTQAQARRQLTPAESTTLHPSSTFKSLPIHARHTSALLRLLYIHTLLNPLNRSPYMASLLLPIYSVLSAEIEPAELAHAEADAFWMFQALVGEVAEMEAEGGGDGHGVVVEGGGVVWMRKLSERVRWADVELFEDLSMKGLDPALPHYSYKWLAPLLTHTLPLPSVLVVWDSILSRPSRLRTTNPKLEYLLDICAAMLCRAKARLARLGKSGHKSPSLWNDEDFSIPPPSPSRPWELTDAFMEGISLLQYYPIRDAGGVERIVQIASDFSIRREEEANNLQANEITNISNTLRNVVWKNFVPQGDAGRRDSIDIGEDVLEKGPSEWADSIIYGDSDDQQPQKITDFASRLGATVWRGITNQSSMDAPPSPESSPGPSPQPSPQPSPKPAPVVDKGPSLVSTPSEPLANIWGYAGRLKDSNMAATLSKVSTNWSIKAREVFHTRSATSPVNIPSPISSSASSSRSSSTILPVQSHKQEASQRGSLPNIDRSDLYSPPPRPAYFRPPRDSWAPPDPEQLKALSVAIPGTPESSSPSQPLPAVPEKEESNNPNPIQSPPPSAWSNSRTPASKSAVQQRSGPRPLLLPSSVHARTDSMSSITATRSASTTPTPPQWQWTDVLRNRVQGRHRESQSSISSISTADTLDTTDSPSARASRVVRLNRDSVSPMAPAYRKMRHRDSSASSLSGSELLSPPPMPHPPLPNANLNGTSSRRGSSDGTASTKGWEQIDVPDSPMTSPPLVTPPVYSLDNAVASTTLTSYSDNWHRNSAVLIKDGLPLPALSISTDSKTLDDHKINSTSEMPQFPPTAASSVVIESRAEPARKSSLTVTSPLSAASDNGSGSCTELTKLPPSPKAPPRIRSKRYTSQRPPHLRVLNRELDNKIASPYQLTPSPNRSDSAEFDLATTPKAADFLQTSPLDQLCSALNSPESQKSGNEKSPKEKIRPRKVSTGFRSRESVADEGDDEGYDDLLSAYESESSQPHSES